MIKANELRIGNWVNQIVEEHEPITPKPIQFDESIWYRIGESIESLDWYEQISLTEEWLVKFGFELNGEDYSIPNFMFEIRKKLKSHSDVFVLFHDSNDMDEIMEIVEISHVHQLQNLYFALTGNEL